MTSTKQGRSTLGTFLRKDEAQPLEKRPRPIRFTVEQGKALETLSDRSAYIRAAVLEKMQADGLLNSEAIADG